MRPVELIVAKLDRVHRYRNGWRARCPACGGRRGDNVSVTESDDGRVLLHCFAGCDAGAVVQALGLTLGDLYPTPIHDDTPEERARRRRAIREVQWGAALDMLGVEAAVIDQAARELAAGLTLNHEDAARVALAARRISDARAVLRDPKPWRPN